MAKNTSILLGDHYEQFVAQQLRSGRFSSASEVIRSALRLFEFEETKRESLIKALKKGERSGFIEDFDRDEFLKGLHRKHARQG
ncbi:MAG: type II toxin-antitoxin system ParD family antitoxin [Flavobacteriales bacterium]|nr:type II toxin-antitoxin system ParD family antitoxin [Flavobacteriales bacterium]